MRWWGRGFSDLQRQWRRNRSRFQPCLAVILNDSQDYFGQTVNLAARVQGLASSRSIFVTQSVVEDKNAIRILESSGLQPMMQRAALRGIADKTTVYEIP